MFKAQIKLRIDLTSGVVEVIRNSASNKVQILGPTPALVKATLDDCLKSNVVKWYAKIVGIETVTATADGLVEVCLSIAPLDVNSLVHEKITDSEKKAKISELHDELWEWLINPLKIKPPLSAERTAEYRRRMLLRGRQIIQLQPLKEHVELLRTIKERLDSDTTGGLALRLKRQFKLP